jgi:hypothetical protein
VACDAKVKGPRGDQFEAPRGAGGNRGGDGAEVVSTTSARQPAEYAGAWRYLGVSALHSPEPKEPFVDLFGCVPPCIAGLTLFDSSTDGFR